MADAEEKAAEKLAEITECPICLGIFNDPRILPCIHTFCLDCLTCTGEKERKKPGEKMPCPICRQEFTIPYTGLIGLQKNFFMENLIEFKTMLQMSNTSVTCDICVTRNNGKTENISTATMRCLECKDNYCDSCSEVHQSQKLNKNHHTVKLGKGIEEEIGRVISVTTCTRHAQRTLDYYCTDCKKVVCVSCVFEIHRFHDCKDVTTLDEEFRQTIEKNAWKILTYADEILSMRKNTDMRKTDFLKQTVEIEKDIHEKSQEFKNMIDEHTQSLLEELSVVKSNRLKTIENEMEEIDRCFTMFRNFEAYCTELSSKGSASDICSSVDELIVRTNELERNHEAFMDRPRQSVQVSFETEFPLNFFKILSRNLLGEIKEATVQNFATVMGISDGKIVTRDVLHIDLHRPNKISAQEEIPIIIKMEAAAAVYCSSMYLTGIGDNADEIWEYKVDSGWMNLAASLVQGRRRHSAAFIDEVLYICGGFADSNNSVLDSVEAYEVDERKCSTVGKLVHCVQSSGNCVPYKSSLYIFGGTDKDSNATNHVQVYDTKLDTCTLLWKPVPRPNHLMQAALCDSSVILVGCDTCFIFNFETENWQERKQFKADVFHFGLVLENERLFVIGGGISGKGIFVKTKWKCRDDIRYVPLRNILKDEPIEWKIHAKLPRPALVHACAKFTSPK